MLRFQDGCEKYLTSNQLTAVTVDRIPVAEESDVTKIYVIPDDKVYLEKGYYLGVYNLLKFNKEEGVGRKWYQADMESDTDEKDMEEMGLNDEI